SLETVASQLGNIQLDKDGQFTGIDTTYGIQYTTQTDIETLTNDIAKTAAASAAASTTDNSQLLALLQQQNTQLSEKVRLADAQTLVLQGMIPEIPQFAQGGPVLRDGLIYAHQGEHVVPAGGTLVSSGTPPVIEVHNHNHYH